MRMCVIYNPVAARGRAAKRVRELRLALESRAEFQATTGPGHAEELALKAAQDGYDVIAAAGGDGTAHEVANGVLRSNRPEVRFAVFPIGSANDYAACLGISGRSALQPENGKVRRCDVGVLRADNGKQRFFINSIGLGFSSTVTVQARRIRWLQGLPLYVSAFLRSLFFHYACTEMEIAFDDMIRRTPTFSLTVAIGQLEGALLLTPDAIPDDGLFDYLHVGRMSRTEILRHLPKIAWGGKLPTDHPELWMGRCREVRLKSVMPLRVHLDGELFIHPPDGVHSLELHMLPQKLPVLV